MDEDKKIKEKLDLMMWYLFKLGAKYIDEKKLIIESWVKNENEFLLFYQKVLDAGFVNGSCTRTINGGATSFSDLTFDGYE